MCQERTVYTVSLQISNIDFRQCVYAPCRLRLSLWQWLAYGLDLSPGKQSINTPMFITNPYLVVVLLLWQNHIKSAFSAYRVRDIAQRESLSLVVIGLVRFPGLPWVGSLTHRTLWRFHHWPITIWQLPLHSYTILHYNDLNYGNFEADVYTINRLDEWL